MAEAERPDLPPGPEPDEAERVPGDLEVPADDEGLEVLLEHLRADRGFDFTQYKRPSLTRRVRRRMADTRCDSFASYLDLLEAEPGELNALLDTVLINVTSFFRDDDFWEVLRRRVVPDLLGRVERDGGPLRVWSAGCATGQEPYSLAMLFAESLGADQVAERVKIYATDVDEAALSVAGRAAYTAHQLEGLPPELLAAHFSPAPGNGDEHLFSNELRRCVIFGSHNLVSDAPISRVDLLLCRNTLMYFNAALQREVVHRLHFSVAPAGYLALGKVEMLLGHRGLFEPIDAGVRIFRKVGGTSPPTFVADERPYHEPVEPPATLAALAFEASTVAQVVVGRDGEVAAANEAARSTFGLLRTDIGRPFRDLELSYRPLELRGHIEAARERGEVITVRDIALGRTGAGEQRVDVVLTPLGTASEPAGVVVAFVDVSRHHALQERLEETRQDLETAYEEVQSTNEELETTNEELQSTNEELETTNEELQSTIEELETTNEELRSTNEEFETMNDELQRVNDQLEVRNQVLQERTAELDHARRYIRAVLDSVQVGVVVVTDDLRVVTWSSGAEDLWGLRADEAEGASLLGLDIGLPVDQLAGPTRTVLSGSEPLAVLELSAHNRRGQAVVAHVECSAMHGGGDRIDGVVLVMSAAGDGREP